MLLVEETCNFKTRTSLHFRLSRSGLTRKSILKVLKLAANLEGNVAARCNCTRHLIDLQQHVHGDFEHNSLIGNRPDMRTHYVIYQKTVFQISLKRKPFFPCDKQQYKLISQQQMQTTKIAHQTR